MGVPGGVCLGRGLSRGVMHQVIAPESLFTFSSPSIWIRHTIDHAATLPRRLVCARPQRDHAPNLTPWYKSVRLAVRAQPCEKGLVVVDATRANLQLGVDRC